MKVFVQRFLLWKRIDIKQAFGTGHLSLIRVSKRPVIMTSFQPNCTFYIYLCVLDLFLQLLLVSVMICNQTNEATSDSTASSNEDVLNIKPNFNAIPKLKQTRDSSLCGVHQYPANSPIEDRFAIHKLLGGGW